MFIKTGDNTPISIITDEKLSKEIIKKISERDNEELIKSSKESETPKNSENN